MHSGLSFLNDRDCVQNQGFQAGKGRIVRKYNHILYYDLRHPLRNSFFKESLPALCDTFSCLIVDDDYPADAPPSLFEKCDVLVTGVFDRYKEKLRSSPNLRRIFMLATDLSDFDAVDLYGRNIRLNNAAGYSTAAVAELSIAIMILSMRNLVVASNSLTAWDGVGCEMRGRTIGIVGAGRIGTQVGQRAALLGMKLTYCGKENGRLAEVGGKRATFEEVVSISDVLSINLPLNASTHAIMNASVLHLIRPECSILCPARPELFDIEALLAVAEQKKLKVWFDGVEDSKIRGMLEGAGPNILLTSSIGARSVDAQDRLMKLAIAELEVSVGA